MSWVSPNHSFDLAPCNYARDFSAIELVGPKDRTTVTILINIAYSLSLVSLAVVVWAVRSWRWVQLENVLDGFSCAVVLD